ncbi:MAG: PIN domain-containing protein [Acidobacteriia bacterium]|nr:PIN domain-containing protein [Terriglobia bacterium]
MAVRNLVFIDANIWLDFYRARNDTALRLLHRTEAIGNQLIVTYQLESEFKRNRQAAIYEGMQELKAPQQVAHPGILSDATATKIVSKNLRDAEKRVAKLRERMLKALTDPAMYDPVYQVCQRLFHKGDDLTLDRENPLKRVIRRRAFRRFLHGCPPRKRNDTSIGDAFNWEWMVHCATQKTAGLVIVSRDADYGITIGKSSYINDDLRQEFSDRVSQKRALLLYSRLSDALKLFDIKVTQQEEASESELVSVGPGSGRTDLLFLQRLGRFMADSPLNLTLLSRDPTVDEVLESLPKAEPAKDT